MHISLSHMHFDLFGYSFPQILSYDLVTAGIMMNSVCNLIFKPISYCFEETKGFGVKASFARRPLSHLIKPGDITKEF